VLEFRKMRKPADALLEEWESGDSVSLAAEEVVLEESPTIGHGAALAHTPPATHGHVGGSAGDGGTSGSGTVVLVEATTGGGADRGTGDAMADRALAGGDGKAVTCPAWITNTFAIAVPAAYLALIVYLIYDMSSKGTDGGLKGGDAAGLVGGIAAITIFLAAFAEGRRTFLERSAEHVVDGLVFAFKAMGVVLPIAGFFFIGNGDFAGRILGIAANEDGTSSAPAFLFDLVLNAQEHIPQNAFVTAFGILIIGMIAGLEGSGFSGLPLTGSLSGTLGPVVGVEPETLAAIGQMGNIWSGGGTLVAWSSLIAVAGFARVSVIELARMCFIPVVAGLFLSTIVAVVVFG